MGRFHVFLADVPRFGAEPGHQEPRRLADLLGGARLVGGLQGLVGLGGELGVDGQEHRAASVPGHLHGVFHPVAASGNRRHIGKILIGGEDVLQDRAELQFAQDPLGLHVRQHFFQVADAAGQGLHLAETLVHLLQPLVHQAEGAGDLALQGFLEPLVHRFPELFGLPDVLLPHLLHPAVQVLPEDIFLLGKIPEPFVLQEERAVHVLGQSLLGGGKLLQTGLLGLVIVLLLAGGGAGGRLGVLPENVPRLAPREAHLLVELVEKPRVVGRTDASGQKHREKDYRGEREKRRDRGKDVFHRALLNACFP